VTKRRLKEKEPTFLTDQMRLDLLVTLAENCKTTMPAVYGDGMCHASAKSRATIGEEI
jgi:hypothetical protein